MSAQALAASQNAGFELLCHPPYLPFVFVLHSKWLAGQARTTILLQQNQSFGEMLDQVHFGCRCLLKSDMMCVSGSKLCLATNFLNAPCTCTILWHFLFSESEFTFTFAICCHPSVYLSVVCNVRVPYSGDWNFWQCFYAIWYLGHLWAFGKNFTEIVPGGTPVGGGRVKSERGSHL